MSTPPNRPEPDGASKSKRWGEDLGVFATDATAKLGRFGRWLRTTNATVSQWVLTQTWRRLALLGFIIFIAAQIVGGITGFDRREVTLDASDLTKPIDIRIHNDGKTVHIQPRIGGRNTRPVEVPIPEVPAAPEAPAAPESAASPASPSAPVVSDKEAKILRQDHAIVFEKDGKRVVIDKNGVRVLEGDEARADAAERAKSEAERAKVEADVAKKAAAKQAEAAKSGELRADTEADNADRIAEQALASAAGKLSAADTQRIRSAISDDLSLQVKAAVEDAKDEVTSAISDEIRAATRQAPRTLTNVMWEFIKFLLVMTFIYLVILKATTSTKRRAAVAVASASEVAERESLKRQVTEAKMQMMQAQVEPHFLFNTLASIDHLIETDPPRASIMQRNLIQYLRAALPQMRENATDLGREIDLVRAYTEILKVRMEERLQVSFNVPNGLRSADFPPMMLQSLVENAIKHGLEPKAEGGRLDVAAQIEHGSLEVTVADTGMGFQAGGAPTSGTGLGLTNIRERLKLLYGERATLVIEANTQDGVTEGTRVTIRVPYQSRRASGDAPTN